MKIVIRCDSSKEIGMGHLIRCLSIANNLKQDHDVLFACSKDESNSLIENEGYSLHLNNFKSEIEFLDFIISSLEPAVILIDKKYNYSAVEIRKIRQCGVKVVLLDIMCDGLSEADEIIYPGVFFDTRRLNPYLDPSRVSQIKYGAEYIILRKNILELKKNKRRTKFPPQELVVTTGGTDPEGTLLHILKYLNKIEIPLRITVLMGRYFVFAEELEALRPFLGDNFSIIPYTEKKLLDADLAICTFGVSLYEMIYLNVPAISIAHSEENFESSLILEEKFKGFINAGYYKKLNLARLKEILFGLVSNEKYYRSMISECRRLIDGKGVRRISELILS